MSPPPDIPWIFGMIRGAALPPAGGIVVKFGGSLLDHPDWPEWAARLLSAWGRDTPVTFVVGGGSIVEGLRQIDGIRRQPCHLSHRLAVEGMGITAKLLAAALGLPLVTRPAAAAGRHAVLDPVAWLASDPDQAATIPALWEVTSDSLAALVAGRAGLDLWLAKSVVPPGHGWSDPARSVPPEDSLTGLAAAGWVDAWFPTAARGLERIGWVVPAG